VKVGDLPEGEYFFSGGAPDLAELSWVVSTITVEIFGDMVIYHP